MKCNYDVDSGMCALKPDRNMRNTSNPYSWLPMNGLKCARKVGSKDKCEIQHCLDSDIKVQRGEHLFGRVGYEGANLYNCANLNGTHESQLIMQDVLQGISGDKSLMNNSAEARNEFYDRYEQPN